MTKFMRNIKLTNFIIAFALLMSALFLSFQLWYLSAINRLTMQYAENNFQTISHDIDFRFQELIDRTKDVTDTISYRTIMQEYLIETDKGEKASLYPFVADYINNTLSTEKQIIALRFYTDEDSFISSFGNWNFSITSAFSAIFEEEKIEKVMQIEEPFFTKPIYFDTLNTPIFAYISPVNQVYGQGEWSDDPIAICVVLCSTKSFERYVSQIKNNTEIILSVDDYILSSTDSALTGGSFKEEFVSNIAVENEIIRYHGEQYMMRTTELEETGISITCLIPYHILASDVIAIRETSLLMIIVSLCIMFAIVIVVCRALYKQVTHLLSQLTADTITDFTYHLDPQGFFEIVRITDFINDMRFKLQKLTTKILSTQEQLYLAEIQKRDTDIKMLQAQINPHFLYNTLECIRSIAIYYGAQEIADISTSMSKILRYSIKGDEIVTLSQELSIVSEYIQIMNIRFMGKYSADIQIAPEHCVCRIPRMLIQPLVENAFYHGMERSEAPGCLKIKSEIHGEQLDISIADNGLGIPPERLKEIQDILSNGAGEQYTTQTGSIGITNVHFRIRYLYGEPYGISLHSTYGEGTVVTVSIPFKT